MNITAADWVLTYLRQLAAGQPHSDDEWAAVVDVCGSHGVSLDWIELGDHSSEATMPSA